MKKLFTLLFALLALTSMIAQISITNNSFSYAQDFNTLATTGTSSTLPTGWVMLEKGGAAADQIYAANNGASNSGNTYSMGSAADRALGALRSGSLSPLYGVSFVNNAASSITSMSVSYLGETWRSARATSLPDTMYVEYAIGATGIDTVNGTWIRIPELVYTSPSTTATSVAGSTAPLSSTMISFTLSGINIPTSSTIHFRFLDGNPAGSDDMMGVDDFQISMVAIPVEMVSFTAKKAGTTNKLAWQTATELNNQYFDVQRSTDGATFQTIGQVKGVGNSVALNNYEFMDEAPSLGTNYYRLQQVDYNGKTTTSKTVAVNTTGKGSAKVFPTLATDKINVLTTSDKEETFTITNMMGQTVLSGRMVNALDINVSQLAKGMYILQVAGDAVKFSKQ